MTDPRCDVPRPLGFGLNALLATSALVYLGYHLLIGLDRDDTNHLETPLALAVARQLEDGSETLYGPFSGQMPLVLIHAPLYYRLAALGAWPLTELGVEPRTAALVSGRLLSLLAMLGVLGASYGLTRLDRRASRRAGLWAVLLVAASPIVASYAVTVRPDTLGIALQTLGILLVLHALQGGRPRTGTLVLAYVVFGLTVCVKQHNVVGLAISSVLLAGFWWRGRLRLGPILMAHGVGLAVVILYYGLEELVTFGMMSRSVFVLPGEFRRINYATWSHVATVVAEVAKRSVGLLALAAACLAVSPRRALRMDRLEAVLGGYLLAELVLMAVLCLNSTGAWVNYAMQPVLLGCVMLARALDRVLASPMAPGSVVRAVPAVALAAVVLLVWDVRLVRSSVLGRLDDRAALRAMLADPRLAAPSSRYFVSRPQHNRVHGRCELAHDEWLYQAYEAAQAAEPRAVWLRQALTDGRIRQVIQAGAWINVPGVDEPLDQLGYQPLGRFGTYHVWERR